MRRVEGEGARRHFRHVDAACGTGETAREEPVATAKRVDDDDFIRQRERDLDGLGQPPFRPFPDHQAIDHDLDRVVPAPVQRELVLQRADRAIDPDTRQAPRAQRVEFLTERSLASPHDRRQHVHPFLGRFGQDRLHHPFHRLRRDRPVARRTVGYADVGEQQTEEVVYLGDGADRRAGIGPGGSLFDGNGGREPVDLIDVRLLHLLEKLTGVGG